MEQKRGLRLLGGMLAAVAVALLLITAVASVDVDAARGAGRGGGKKGGGGTPCSTCVLTVNPNPVPWESTSFVLSGTGFATNQTLVVQTPGVCCIQSATTDGSGAFTMNYQFWARHQGVSYTVAASTDLNMTNLLAYTTFTVQ